MIRVSFNTAAPNDHIRRPSQKCLVSVILTEKYGSVGRQHDQILIFSIFFRFELFQGHKNSGWLCCRHQYMCHDFGVACLVLSYKPTFVENQLERYDIRSKQSSEVANREVYDWKLSAGCHFYLFVAQVRS